MQKVALVTGGGLRLGREIALHLAKNGWDIALHYHSSKKQAEKTREEIINLQKRCEIFPLDFTSGSGLKHFFAEICQKFPQLNLLVNSASVYQAATIEESSWAMWEQHFSVNLRVPFFLTQEFAKHNKTRFTKKSIKIENDSSDIKRANIINILDNKIAFAQYQYAIYVLSKKTLAEFSQMAAMEFAPYIRVNAIAPGIVLPMPSHKKADYMQWRLQGVPLCEQGDPKQILMAVDYLLQNEFVTGQMLTVDGGESFAFTGRNFSSYSKE